MKFLIIVRFIKIYFILFSIIMFYFLSSESSSLLSISLDSLIPVIFNNDMQLSNKFLSSVVNHLNISGSDINEQQLENIKLLYLALLVFHLDISGIDIKDDQYSNIPSMSLTLSVFQ